MTLPLGSSEAYLPADPPSFRTKNGHELKTQKWYRGKVNLWNDPIHSGSISWRLFHGPRITQDAEIKTAVKTHTDADLLNKSRLTHLKYLHDETRMRMAVQKADQLLKQTARSYSQVSHLCASHLHSDFLAYPRTNTFSDFSLTIPKLRKVAVTGKVLQRNADAFDHVRRRLKEEHELHDRIRAWEENRHDLLLDEFRQRQENTDKLARISGQMVVHNAPVNRAPLSDNMERISKPKKRSASVNSPRELLECRGLLGFADRLNHVSKQAKDDVPIRIEMDFSKTGRLVKELEKFEESLKAFEFEPKATGALDFALAPKKRTLKV